MFKFWRHCPVLFLTVLVCSLACTKAASGETPRPNFVLIYASNLGMGDVGCYGATSVKTPHLDRLAKEGIRFTDAHSAAATCTPSRLAMLIGSYPWRQKNTGVGTDDAVPGTPALIEPGTTTIASILQQSGYRSSVVGKWHLGLGNGELDWNQEITPGPLDIGFDESFIVPTGEDSIPAVYVENRRAYRWGDEDKADVLTNKACAFIERNTTAGQPFFLYFALHDIPARDAITKVDWCVGQVLDRLKSLGIADNTLVIFSSDNGPLLNDVDADPVAEVKGRRDPAAGFRGGKGSIFEAGTRVPMLARWPGVIAPGQVSDALVSQIDYATNFASIVGHTLRPGECIDSSEQVPALFGHDERGRWFLVQQASTLAIRHESWKYIEPATGPPVAASTGIETGLNTAPQLYDLETDPGERNNLANKYPKKVAEMKKVLSLIKNEGKKAKQK